MTAVPDPVTLPEQPSQHQPLIEHLIELRQRLLYSLIAFVIAFAISYYYSEHIFVFLVAPLTNLLRAEGGRRLIFTGLTEGFLTYVKVAFFTATALSLPVIVSQIWMFIAPGLYEKEKKSFLPFLAATPVLFISGCAFAYYGIIPNAWKFFLSFEMTGGPGMLPIQLEARLNEYLSLVMQLLLAFGISFQLPVALVLMARSGIIKIESLAKNRKYAFLLIMIASAFLTPPDVLSMIGLALPLYLLYELSVWLVKRVKVS